MGIAKNSILKLEDIKEELKLIEGSEIDYITPTGKVYSYREEYGGYFLKKNNINKHNGYTYCGINYKDGRRSSRVHILVAKAFLPNPNNYRIVGHKHNNKSCTDVNELYWTNTQENTKRAVNDGLLKNEKGINNETSMPVKAINVNGDTVGVYGSARECSRCIENISNASICKLMKKQGNYTPRSKKYKYIPISREEYMSFPNELKGVHLIESNLKGSKQPKQFKAINLITGEIVISDNQKQFAKKYKLKQSDISKAVLNNGCNGNWKFELIQEIDVKESSAYKNQINSLNNIKIEDINTGEVKIFNTGKELKDYLGLTGHDIRQYISKNHILMDKYKISIL